MSPPVEASALATSDASSRAAHGSSVERRAARIVGRGQPVVTRTATPRSRWRSQPAEIYGSGWGAPAHR